jgi:hypothetical protein
MEGLKMADEDEVINGVGSARSDLTDALIEFGKKSITDSVSVINEYIKTMIPLTTGLITVYFALLEFVGVKTAIDAQVVSELSLIQAPIYMLYSLIAFIVTSFPVFLKFDLGALRSVTTYRNIMIAWRYTGALIGMGFFLYGLYLVIITVTKIISS